MPVNTRPWLAALPPLLLVLAWFAPSAGAAATADARFGAVSHRYLEEFGRYSPVAATQAGDHRFDGELDDLSPAGRARAKAWANELLRQLQAIDHSALSRANQVDAAMLENSLRYSVWSEERLRDWSWDPFMYSQLTGQALYGLLAREFAPLPDRLRSLTARLEKLPRLLAQTRANLIPERVPAVHAETAVKQNPGVLSLVDELVVPNLGVLAPADRARLERAIAGAREAVQAHQRWLEQDLRPRAKGDFRIGRELYEERLRFALMSPLSREEIRRRAEAAVISTREEMYAVARSVLAGRAGAPPTPEHPTHAEQQAAIAAALELANAERPARDGVVDLAKADLAEATAFVRAKGFLSVPDEPVEVIVMPEFQRGFAVAYCDAPGPLDKGQRTFFSVSPIPKEWTQAQVDSFLREYNTRSIANLTIHEAMPGHYLQLARSNRYPSLLRAMLGSGPFVEGWAVYTERLMQEQGFRGNDPLMHLVQLKWYLRATTNAIMDSAIHVDGMTREEAMKLMTETGFQEEREAAGKWVRAQLSSTQLSTYFVGFQEHFDMRAEAERRWGAAFDLKAYHERVLSYGSPPVRFVRELIFEEPIR
ncbi:MAG TPA: DUF885 domain-containing protein [Steroidobacteraceae bacterium]|nr:DUF885 domain-containing protein [Steroidobacteraceae bacterium]